MKLWKEENQVRQARPASDVFAKNLRGLAPAPPWLLRHCDGPGRVCKDIDYISEKVSKLESRVDDVFVLTGWMATEEKLPRPCMMSFAASSERK